MDNESAVKYLESLLNRSFRAHTSDGRMFLGEFKCTDNVLRFKVFFYRNHVDDVYAGKQYCISKDLRVPHAYGKGQKGGHGTTTGRRKCCQSTHDKPIPWACCCSRAAYHQVRVGGKETMGVAPATWLTKSQPFTPSSEFKHLNLWTQR